MKTIFKTTSIFILILLQSTPLDDPPAYSSPSPQHTSPKSGEFSTPSRTAGPVSTPASRPSDAKNLGEIRSSASNPATNSSTLGAAAAAVSNAVPTSADELKAQLAEAKAQIAKLTEQASEGLRQRRGGAQTATTEKSGSSTAASQRLSSPAGVPVQIVAALCLLSFLLAYFFF